MLDFVVLKIKKEEKTLHLSVFSFLPIDFRCTQVCATSKKAARRNAPSGGFALYLMRSSVALSKK
jgi:hypothetical protein